MPCNVRSLSTEMLQIRWKIRGWNSKMLQIPLKWQLPAPNCCKFWSITFDSTNEWGWEDPNCWIMNEMRSALKPQCIIMIHYLDPILYIIYRYTVILMSTQMNKPWVLIGWYAQKNDKLESRMRLSFRFIIIFNLYIYIYWYLRNQCKYSVGKLARRATPSKNALTRCVATRFLNGGWPFKHRGYR